MPRPARHPQQGQATSPACTAPAKESHASPISRSRSPALITATPRRPTDSRSRSTTWDAATTARRATPDLFGYSMFTPGCGVASITHPPSEQAQFDRLGAARPGGGSSRVREKGRVCSVAPCGVTKQFQAREGRPVGRAGVHRARTVTASMVKRRAGRRAQHQSRGSLLGCRKKRHCDASAPPPGLCGSVRGWHAGPHPRSHHVRLELAQ